MKVKVAGKEQLALMAIQAMELKYRDELCRLELRHAFGDPEVGEDDVESARRFHARFEESLEWAKAGFLPTP